jgi:hypothetical protein
MTEDRKEGEEGEERDDGGTGGARQRTGGGGIYNFLSKVTHLNTIPVQVGLNLRFF